MVGQLLVVLRILGMSASLLAVFGLHRVTMASDGRVATVFQTVYLQCILIIVSLFYYGLLKFCSNVMCFGRVKAVQLASLERRQASPVGLNSLVPRLTIRNVWILVYGLGFVLFIAGYCFIGLHPICLAFAGLGMAVLGADELICPVVTLHRLHYSSRFVALFLALVALVFVSADLLDSVVVKYVTTLDIYSIMFGLVLPFGSQFILIIVRDDRRYSLGTVVEVCEFGFPFTAFLGIFHLGVAYGQRFQSESDTVSAYQTMVSGGSNASLAGLQNWYHYNDKMVYTILETNWPFLVFYSLAPILVGPALVCYMACVLEGSAVDPLISVSLALCVEHLSTRPLGGPTSSFGICATVFAVLSLGMRTLSEFRVRLGRDPFSAQTDSLQLPQGIVWFRGGQSRESEVDELTRDLQSDSVL
jgi:hypothetical protein